MRRSVYYSQVTWEYMILEHQVVRIRGLGGHYVGIWTVFVPVGDQNLWCVAFLEWFDSLDYRSIKFRGLRTLVKASRFNLVRPSPVRCWLALRFHPLWNHPLWYHVVVKSAALDWAWSLAQEPLTPMLADTSNARAIFKNLYATQLVSNLEYLH